jgi:hypothetical protein
VARRHIDGVHALNPAKLGLTWARNLCAIIPVRDRGQA